MISEGEGRTPWDLLLRNVHLATLAEGPLPSGASGEGRGLDPAYGPVLRGALAVSGDRIAWVGAEARLPAGRGDPQEVDGGGGWLTPGLVDCHTHLVWGGSRGEEFELRLAGLPYTEIARRGGGIRSTVAATRRMTAAELERSAARRLGALMDDGVTTVEIKSGYGLESGTEERMLRVARALGTRHPVTVTTTFLGAHALPPEFEGRREEYMDAVLAMLPPLVEAGLVDAVDVFCEGIAFSVEESDRLFRRARTLGLPVKAHAEQLSLLGGAALVARHGGLSADHLEYLDEAGVRALAEAGTVAVLLPGAFHTLQETRRPPVAALRAAGVPMAVATDANPGTSPLLSLRSAMNLACIHFGLTPAEALRGATQAGARALGLRDRGILAPGLRADLVLWGVDHPAELVATLGGRLMEGRWWGGRGGLVSEAS